MTRHFLVVGLAVALVAGCAKREPSPEREAKAAAKAEKPQAVQAPTGSKLAKIKPGMKSDEVEALLGRPDDEASHETGQRWMPYNMGSDVRRMIWTYKGLGRVNFRTDNAFKGGRYIVDHTEYDPSEDGRAKK